MLKFIAQIVARASRIRAGAVRVPLRPGDVGYDLCSKFQIQCRRGITWIHTDVAIEAKPPLWFLVKARSSLHKKGLFVLDGVIDGGYQGELLIAVANIGDEPIMIESGEYIAQCIFFHVVQPELAEVTEFVPSDRGARGFGSTDR